MSARRTLLLDTNLLVLLAVGLTDKSLVGRHKRTTEYVEEDFDMLYSMIHQFDELCTTPNILTETSNLLAQSGSANRQEEILRTLAKLTEGADEEYVPSKQACRRKEFLRLGLADSVSLEKAPMVNCVLTADHDLFVSVEKAGGFAVNFNHVRTVGWIWPA